VPCLLINHNVPWYRFPGGIGELVMRGKFITTEVALRAGLRVVFSEMDVFWRANLVVLDGHIDADFIVSEHPGGFSEQSEINIGVYIARPTPAVQHVFRLVTLWIQQANRFDSFHPCGCFDQKLLDFAVRGTNKFIRTCAPPRSVLMQLYDSMSKTLRYSSIPWHVVPHFGGAVAKKMHAFNTSGGMNKALAIHVGGHDSPLQRTMLAYKYKLLVSSGSPR